MKNSIDSNFAIAIVALVAACVGFSFWLNTSILQIDDIAQPTAALQKYGYDDESSKFVTSRSELYRSDDWKRYVNEDFGIDFFYPKSTQIFGEPFEYEVDEKMIDGGIVVSVVNPGLRERMQKIQTDNGKKHGGENEDLEYTSNNFVVTVRQLGEVFFDEFDHEEWLVDFVSNDLSPSQVIDLNESQSLDLIQGNRSENEACVTDDTLYQYDLLCHKSAFDMAIYRDSLGMLYSKTYLYGVVNRKIRSKRYSSDFYYEVTIDNNAFGLPHFKREVWDREISSAGLKSIEALVRFFPPIN